MTNALEIIGLRYPKFKFKDNFTKILSSKKIEFQSQAYSYILLCLQHDEYKQIEDTTLITGMFYRNKASIKFDTYLADNDFTTIKNILKVPHFLKSISGMQSGKGMISQADFIRLVMLCGGDFDENGKVINIDVALLKSISGMQSGKGMISQADFIRLVMLCGGDFDENGKVINIDVALLKSISGMQSGKGMISQADFIRLVMLCGGDFDENGKVINIDVALLKSVSGMQAGRGMMTQSEIDILEQAVTEKYYVYRTCFMRTYLDEINNKKRKYQGGDMLSKNQLSVDDIDACLDDGNANQSRLSSNGVSYYWQKYVGSDNTQILPYIIPAKIPKISNNKTPYNESTSQSDVDSEGDEPTPLRLPSNPRPYSP